MHGASARKGQIVYSFVIEICKLRHFCNYNNISSRSCLKPKAIEIISENASEVPFAAFFLESNLRCSGVSGQEPGAPGQEDGGLPQGPRFTRSSL